MLRNCTFKPQGIPITTEGIKSYSEDVTKLFLCNIFTVDTAVYVVYH